MNNPPKFHIGDIIGWLDDNCKTTVRILGFASGNRYEYEFLTHVDSQNHPDYIGTIHKFYINEIDEKCKLVSIDAAKIWREVLNGQ